MKTIIILFALSICSLAENKKPNFVFILADDLGIKDMSGEGSTLHETPHIDSIANEGMRFTEGYSTCQVCSPSRASIMTGKYPVNHGITDYIGAPVGLAWKRNDKVLPSEYRRHLAHEETTLAEALAAGGYKSFFAGKWHLGDEGSHPEDHGFQINKGGHGKGSPPGGFFSPYKNPKLTDGPAGESLPIRLAEETASFIKANQDQPFLAYLSFYSVHSPIQTTPCLWKKYRDKAQQSPHQGDRFIIDRTNPVRQVQDCPIYGGMMESMDDAVGIVLKALDDLGLADNTVVIFTSDNGGVSSGDAYATSCLPLRGGKGRQWEGGIKQPYYIKVPGITKARSRTSTPVTGTDFYPTILELAGLPAMPQQHVDGLSLVPLFKGNKITDRALFWHYPHYGNQGGEPSAIIRKDDWKLIHYYEDGHDELYQLSKDIGEQNDLAAKNPDVAQTLRKELDTWLKDTGAFIPEPDTRYDPVKKKVQQEAVVTTTMPQLERTHARYLESNYKPNENWWGSKPSQDVAFRLDTGELILNLGGNGFVCIQREDIVQIRRVIAALTVDSDITEHINAIITYVADDQVVIDADWEDVNMRKDFLYKLDVVLELVIAARAAEDPEEVANIYAAARKIVDDELIKKTDGLQKIGTRKYDDWVVSQKAQDIIYPDLSYLSDYLWLKTL